MTKQPKTTEVEWTSISVTMAERNRWKAMADAHSRTMHFEMMVVLDAVEELERDIDADTRTRIDLVKRNRDGEEG